MSRFFRRRLRSATWLFQVFFLTLAIAAVSWPALALDRLAFQIPREPDGLRKVLTDASLLQTRYREGTTDPQELFSAARADYERLLVALYGEGFYSGVIHIYVDGREASAISALDIPQDISDILVTVDPGPQFRFGRATVAPLAPNTTLPERFASGRKARSPVIGDAAETAVSAWRESGHPKAELAGQKVVADHAARTLDADLTVAPGPVLRFGVFTFSGAQAVRDDRVRAIAGVPEGRTVLPRRMDEINDRLLRSQVFRSVSLRQADAPNPDGTLDIHATLVEQAPRRVGFGGEIASLDGASASAYWLHRNLFGGAERLRLDGEVSGIGAQQGGTDFILGAKLTRPATFTPDTDLTFGVRLARLNEEDFNSYNFGITIGVEHRFSRSLTGGAGAGFDYLRVTDSTGTREFQTLSLPLNLTWDKRDVPLNATRGFYLSGEVMPFGEITGATLGTRAFLDARIYQGVADGRLVLAARGQAGSILGTSLRDTTRDMLFYSGGAGTVRGHPFQSLGVFVLGPNQRSGGRSFVATSLEARVNVTDTIGVVGFYDAGFVGADAFLSDQGDWQSGAGLGLRYNTGIGPVRFDLALPVSGDTGEGLQFYIGIGQAF